METRAGRGKGLWVIGQWQGRHSRPVVQDTCVPEHWRRCVEPREEINWEVQKSWRVGAPACQEKEFTSLPMEIDQKSCTI